MCIYIYIYNYIHILYIATSTFTINSPHPHHLHRRRRGLRAHRADGAGGVHRSSAQRHGDSNRVMVAAWILFSAKGDFLGRGLQ